MAFNIGLWLLLLIVIILDLIGVLNLLTKISSVIVITLASHGFALSQYYFRLGYNKNYYCIIVAFIIYLVLRLSIMPIRKKGFKNLRLLILIGGRRLIISAWLSIVLQIGLYIFIAFGLKNYNLGYINYFADTFIAVVLILSIFYNGCIRIILTSKWLSVIKRVIAFLFLPTPLINIFITYYLCHTAYYEYEYMIYKITDKEVNEQSDMCKTKYPLVMIHGIGFRDFRFFNYWGRIPRELKRLGATVYYGNQEALGTIECNGKDIKNKILSVIKETDCEKVNIIAHSKGGLDARYVISVLGMDDYVASLTTVSTPHRGVKAVDYLCHLPDFIYKGVANFFDLHFKRLGDKNPDFYTATRAFSTYKSKEFNETVKNSPKVYYQSYTTIIKNIFSDYILMVPYMAIRFIEGKNDGLVSVESAKWGEFRGVISNKYRRGISHGDIIDLKREDYRGFDVIKWYVDVVKDLKEKGF